MYLCLEKQNVFGIAVHPHHRSCQTGYQRRRRRNVDVGGEKTRKSQKQLREEERREKTTLTGSPLSPCCPFTPVSPLIPGIP